jgi:hypothetical protein
VLGALAVLRALRRSIEHAATHGEVVNVCVALALVQPLDVCNSSPASRVANQSDRYNR